MYISLETKLAECILNYMYDGNKQIYDYYKWENSFEEAIAKIFLMSYEFTNVQLVQLADYWLLDTPIPTSLKLRLERFL